MEKINVIIELKSILEDINHLATDNGSIPEPYAGGIPYLLLDILNNQSIILFNFIILSFPNWMFCTIRIFYNCITKIFLYPIPKKNPMTIQSMIFRKLIKLTF